MARNPTGTKRKQIPPPTTTSRKASKKNTFITEHFDVDPNPSFETGISSDDQGISFQSNKTTPKETTQLGGKRKKNPVEIENPKKHIDTIVADENTDKNLTKESIDESTYERYALIERDMTQLIMSIRNSMKDNKMIHKDILNINNLLKPKGFKPFRSDTTDINKVIKTMKLYTRPQSST